MGMFTYQDPIDSMIIRFQTIYCYAVLYSLISDNKFGGYYVMVSIFFPVLTFETRETNEDVADC
jgi:hypothetical protein